LGTLSDIDLKSKRDVERYLQRFEQRANGSLMTPAAWIRKFVMAHPDYKKDSDISEETNYDLMWNILMISSGKLVCEDLTPALSA
jgi:glutamate--cysteine ligase catalytic subunit